MKLDRDIVIIDGSLPPGITASKITSFVRILKKKGVFVMVDMPSKHLKEVIKARPHFIKPNLKEF